jgi:hypothetical protein
MMRVSASGWVVLALALAGTAARAQDAVPDGGVPTLHAYTNLVQVPVLVLDTDLNPMAPVAQRRFFVSLDGGPPFHITHVRLEGDDPISLAVVLDIRQPFPALMEKFDDALAGLVPDSLNARDHVSIYSMSCELVSSTANVSPSAVLLKQSVDEALKPWRMRGRDGWKRDCRRAWNLWDTLGNVSHLLQEQRGRRVILVVTDGVDRGSASTWNQLREYAQQSGVAIFGLTQPMDHMLNSSNSRNAENLFNSVCQLTGGMILTADGKDLAEQLTHFISLLRGRYIVEFPHAVSTVAGDHDMNITIENTRAFIRPSGAGVPLDDPAVLNDPTTVKSDPANAPQMGKQKILPPH